MHSLEIIVNVIINAKRCGIAFTGSQAIVLSSSFFFFFQIFLFLFFYYSLTCIHPLQFISLSPPPPPPPLIHISKVKYQEKKKEKKAHTHTHTHIQNRKKKRKEKKGPWQWVQFTRLLTSLTTSSRFVSAFCNATIRLLSCHVTSLMSHYICLHQMYFLNIVWTGAVEVYSCWSYKYKYRILHAKLSNQRCCPI